MESIIAQQLQNLHPMYRRLVESDYISSLARSFGTKLNFNDAQIDDFADELFLFMIFLYSESDLISSLNENFNITNEEAGQVVSLITDQFPNAFREGQLTLASIQEGNQTLKTNHRTKETDSRDTPLQYTPIETLTSEIAEAEAAMKNLSQFHTMAGDMAAQQAAAENPAAQPATEPTYSSRQEDLVPPPTMRPTQPAQSQTDEARWGQVDY